MCSNFCGFRSSPPAAGGEQPPAADCASDPFADFDASSEDDGKLAQNEVVLEDNCWLVVPINFLLCVVDLHAPRPTVYCYRGNVDFANIHCCQSLFTLPTFIVARVIVYFANIHCCLSHCLLCQHSLFTLPTFIVYFANIHCLLCQHSLLPESLFTLPTFIVAWVIVYFANIHCCQSHCLLCQYSLLPESLFT